MTDSERRLIERCAAVMVAKANSYNPDHFSATSPTAKERVIASMQHAFEATGIPLSVLAALFDKTWVAVPKEPTLNMVEAARENAADCFGDIWREMHTVAPAEPEAGDGERQMNETDPDHLVRVLASSGLAMLDRIDVLERENATLRTEFDTIRALTVQQQNAQIARLQERPTFHPTHRHVKYGTEYEVIGTAELEATCDPIYGSALQIYVCPDGKWRAREMTEFEGWFVKIISETEI